MLGALTLVMADSGRRYGEEDRDVALSLGRRAGLAVEKAQLYAAEQRARERLAFLAEASTQLVASLDYQVTLEQIARLCVPRLADWCVVDMLADDGTIVMEILTHIDPAKVQWARAMRKRFVVHIDQPVGSSQVIRTGEPLLMSNITDEVLQLAARDEEELRMLRIVGYSSLVVVPLRAHDRIIGSLGLVTTNDSNRQLTPDDVTLAEELARRAGVALDNARLYQAAAEARASAEQASRRVTRLQEITAALGMTMTPEQEARAAAEEAVTLRDKFLSIASHELKTPLTSMLLQTQLLQRRVARAALLGEREQRTLQVVAEQAQRLDRMITSLLDISRLELGQLSLSRATVNLCALAQRVVTEVQPTTDSHIVTCTAPEEELLVDGDELRLEQVLQNLLQNAIKYSPDGGPIEVVLAPEAGQVCLTVSDRGMGFPAEIAARLFERFYWAPNADPQQISGLGIGLYVVQEIVRLHGGSVRAEPQEHGGSRFIVCLPQYRV